MRPLGVVKIRSQSDPFKLICASSIPCQRRRDRDDAAGVLLPMVGLGALEDPSLVSSAADLEGLTVEVIGP